MNVQLNRARGERLSRCHYGAALPKYGGFTPCPVTCLGEIVRAGPASVLQAEVGIEHIAPSVHCGLFPAFRLEDVAVGRVDEGEHAALAVATIGGRVDLDVSPTRVDAQLVRLADRGRKIVVDDLLSAGDVALQGLGELIFRERAGGDLHLIAPCPTCEICCCGHIVQLNWRDELVSSGQLPMDFLGCFRVGTAPLP